MKQNYTSKGTSVNKGKLPGSTKFIDWETYRGKNVLDFGGGKYDNLKEYLKKTYDINLYIYDKYNRTAEENSIACNCHPELIVCNNVLNVLDNEDSIINIALCLSVYSVLTIYSIYEGDKSGIGKQTGSDQYQRNQRTKDYKKYFDRVNLNTKIKGKLIYITREETNGTNT